MDNNTIDSNLTLPTFPPFVSLSEDYLVIISDLKNSSRNIYVRDLIEKDLIELNYSRLNDEVPYLGSYIVIDLLNKTFQAKRENDVKGPVFVFEKDDLHKVNTYNKILNYLHGDYNTRKSILDKLNENIEFILYFKKIVAYDKLNKFEVGTIEFKREHKICYIKNYKVDEFYRNQGIFTKMFNILIEACKTLEVNEIKTKIEISNIPMNRLCSKLKFTKAATIYSIKL